MSIGFSDKLYWRPQGRAFHCFRPVADMYGGPRFYESLCEDEQRLWSGGQANRRPPLEERCERCNALEMARRGWSVPGPVRAGWGEE